MVLDLRKQHLIRTTKDILRLLLSKAITAKEEEIDWITLDVGLTTSVGISSHLYLFGYNDRNIKPPHKVQGYRIGAKLNEKLSLGSGTTYSADVLMVDNEISTTGLTSALGETSSVKEYKVTLVNNSTFTIGAHKLITGEKIVINSDVGDLPENIEAHKVYFVIKESGTQIKIASSVTNAENDGQSHFMADQI